MFGNFYNDNACYRRSGYSGSHTVYALIGRGSVSLCSTIFRPAFKRLSVATRFSCAVTPAIRLWFGA